MMKERANGVRAYEYIGCVRMNLSSTRASIYWLRAHEYIECAHMNVMNNYFWMNVAKQCQICWNNVQETNSMLKRTSSALHDWLRFFSCVWFPEMIFYFDDVWMIYRATRARHSWSNYRFHCKMYLKDALPSMSSGNGIEKWILPRPHSEAMQDRKQRFWHRFVFLKCFIWGRTALATVLFPI